uniref:Alba domain-containing protein n=1 Tax=Ascaris lumbricoides TaxID=6252 RepID=A0A0M3IVV9_ASCLU
MVFLEGSELSRGHKLVVVVLCRNRGPYYVSAIVATLKKRFASGKRKVDIIVYGKGTNMARNLSEHSLAVSLKVLPACIFAISESK